jgi:phosphoribosylformylglycinamidine cyclo-ligase
VDDYIDELNMRLGDCLLQVHKCYLNVINTIKYLTQVHAIAHITGGGIRGNTIRLIPAGVDLEIDWFGWERPKIFQLIQRLGEVTEEDMRQTFNLGVGLVIVVSKKGSEKVLESLNNAGEKPFIIGKVVESIEQ